MTDPDKVRELVTTIEVYHRKCEDDGGEPCEELTAARTLTALLQRVTELEAAERERDELRRIRDLLMKAVARAVGHADWEDPLTAAVKHAEQVAALREALERAEQELVVAEKHLRFLSTTEPVGANFALQLSRQQITDDALERVLLARAALAPYLSEGEKPHSR